MSPWASGTYLGRYRGRLILGSGALLATNGLALAVPYLLGRTIDALRGGDAGGEVPRLAMMMIGFALAQAVARIVSRVLLLNAARMAEADLRSALFAHLMVLEPAYYRKHPVGDVMSRLTSDVQTVRAMWGQGILNLVNTTVLFGAALVLMLGIDPWLTLWALLPYPLVVALGSLYGRRIYRSSRAVQEEMGSLSTSLQEDLGGIAIIKTYTLEEERGKVFGGRSQRLLEKNMDLTRVRGQLMPLLGGMASVGTVIVLFAGGKAVIDRRIELGEMVQMSGYLALLVWPTLALGWMISLLQRGRASWRRLTEILEQQPAIADREDAIELAEVKGELALRDLRIEIGDKVLVDGVSLDIPAGTVTAIVGRLGSGKSLLVEAIPRLIEVPRGSVLLDGHDVCDLKLATLRGAIGYAPQEAFLFSTTIAENIAVGLPHRTAPARTRDDITGGDPVGPEGRADGRGAEEVAVAVRQAAVEAGLAPDLVALPDGLDTVVGERGVTLSGGQRQRVALARALVSRPRVLILDDSLSSVDAETERQILEQLEEVMRGRTAILISHRVAAVRRAHQIAVLDGGRLVERGTHAELLARGGVYAELYRTQLEEELAA